MLDRLLARKPRHATMEDVDACYRLLLDRAPDAEGLTGYRRRTAAEGLTVLDVVGEIIASPEYARVRTNAQSEPATVAIDTERFRLHVFADDYAIGHALAATGTYEREVSETLAGLLAPGSVFVDVGANYGWHSLLAASIVGKTGRVVAVEPNPLNVRLLAQSASDNGFMQITVVTAATSDRDGFGALETDGSNGRIIALDSGLVNPVPCSYVVPLRQLDSIVAEAGNPPVGVVKIDVEGFELATLRGASDLIERHHPVIVSEFFPTALSSTGGVSPESYLRALRDLGYSLSVIGREGRATDAEILHGLGGDDHVDLVATAA